MADKFRVQMKQINTRMIFSDDYQREINTTAVKRIIKNFDPNIVNAPKVSYRGGKYWVFDGQHTIAALKQMNGGEDLMIDCKVYYDMSYEDEARLFSLQEGIVTKVRIEDKLRALREAKDETVIAFIRATEVCGLSCDFKNYGGNKRLVCYKAAYDIFTKSGEEHYKKLLSIDVSSWKGSADSTRAEVIKGVDLFMRHYEGEYSKDRLIKKLSEIDPYRDIVLAGKNDPIDKGARRFERMILEIYNKNLTEGHKLPWKN